MKCSFYFEIVGTNLGIEKVEQDREYASNMFRHTGQVLSCKNGVGVVSGPVWLHWGLQRSVMIDKA